MRENAFSSRVVSERLGDGIGKPQGGSTWDASCRDDALCGMSKDCGTVAFGVALDKFAGGEVC